MASIKIHLVNHEAKFTYYYKSNNENLLEKK